MLPELMICIIQILNALTQILANPLSFCTEVKKLLCSLKVAISYFMDSWQSAVSNMDGDPWVAGRKCMLLW